MLLVSTSSAEQGLRKPPSYVGSAVFNSPPPSLHELAQFPAYATDLHPKLAEIYAKLKAYVTSAVEMVKSHFKGSETLVFAGIIGAGLAYTLNVIKSLFGKCKSASVNHVWASRPHDTYGFNNYYKSTENGVDEATSRVWSAVTNGECLQKAACLLGKQTGRYNNANDIFRFLRRLPSRPVVEAFLKSADGYDDCNAYDCD